MSSTYGENLKLSIFGQSHGKAIGMTLDGIAAGLPVNNDDLRHFLSRRAPGRSALTTTRQEADEPIFLSGIMDGFTCGGPIAAIIENTDAHSADYRSIRDIPRPGHADLTAHIKYGDHWDHRGGGHFSGRLTAPLCIAGGLCLQWLEAMGITVGCHLIQIGGEVSPRLDPVRPQLEQIGKVFPTLSADAAERFQMVIEDAAAEGDSVGGRMECAIVGVPAGLGEPMFGGVENRISQLLYGIPAVKNVGFGYSDAFAAHRGSETNDPFTPEDGRITSPSNHCGGILGGITTGMPVIFDVTVKPTPSISKPQQSVSLEKIESVSLSVGGRHDPCIALRAVPVVEAAAAIAIYDLILGQHRR